MLNLTRKAGESILIGDNMRIVILDVHGGIVKVGIAAPRETLILREELTKHSSKAEQKL